MPDRSGAPVQRPLVNHWHRNIADAGNAGCSGGRGDLFSAINKRRTDATSTGTGAFLGGPGQWCTCLRSHSNSVMLSHPCGSADIDGSGAKQAVPADSSGGKDKGKGKGKSKDKGKSKSKDKGQGTEGSSVTATAPAAKKGQGKGKGSVPAPPPPPPAAEMPQKPKLGNAKAARKGGAGDSEPYGGPDANMVRRSVKPPPGIDMFAEMEWKKAAKKAKQDFEASGAGAAAAAPASAAVAPGSARDKGGAGGSELYGGPDESGKWKSKKVPAGMDMFAEVEWKKAAKKAKQDFEASKAVGAAAAAPAPTAAAAPDAAPAAAEMTQLQKLQRRREDKLQDKKQSVSSADVATLIAAC